MFDRFGAETVLAAWALFEAQCRDTIRKTLESRIPDGTYESEDAVDGDGMSGRSVHARMRLIKEGGRLALGTRAPDGSCESEGGGDGDGMSGRSFHVRLRLIKEGGRIALDTRASDDQARG